MTSAFNSPNSRALVAFPFSRLHNDSRRETTEPEPEQWQPILHASNQVVLYNPRSHALSIAAASSEGVLPGGVVARRQRRLSADGARHVIGELCPYCKQDLPPDFSGFEHHPGMDSDAEVIWEENMESSGSDEYEEVSSDPAYHSRASDYFRLLAIANETSSRRPSRSSSPYRVDDGDTRRGRSGSRIRSEEEDHRSTRGAFPAEKMAEGYFKTFFQEEYKLGMGANGSVFLCQHVLDGNPLGHFAVKKIAVGESHSYLLKILKEVRLLERLHHPNIITYHHAWLENAQFSSFGPKVPTLHVLMQWAEGGSLDDFIDIRLGRKSAHIHMHPGSIRTPPLHMGEPTTPTQTSTQLRYPDSDSLAKDAAEHAPSGDVHTRSARIRAFRAYQRAPPGEKERMRREMEQQAGGSAAGAPAAETGPRGEWTAVHLLSAQEVKSLFHDVVEGLAFLHDKSILHLDLKPGNVLLTWDEDRLIPRAMLSDFGTSRDMINSTRTPRSGNTGTLEYTAPESLPSPYTGLLRQIDSKADMWSLGMILHKLLFFKLPYRYAATGDACGEPISTNDEGAKMDKLEKEVQEYPGFKSTPNLVLGFEARRLPRAYLVLLENLLHKSPAGRPSCERVSAAIREGKLDPLPEAAAGTLPVARPRAEVPATPPPADPPAEAMGAVAEVLSPESTRLLALPPPSEILGPEQGRWRLWLAHAVWAYDAVTRALWGAHEGAHRERRGGSSWAADRRWRAGMRVLRSALLGAKVLSLARAYGAGDDAVCPRRAVLALLLAAALADTVVDHERLYAVRELRGAEKDSAARGASQERRKKARRRAMKSVGITAGLAVFHVAALTMSGVRWSSLWV